MPRPRELDPAASPLHFFGAEFRRAREAAGMSQGEFAAKVPCDISTVSRVEAGEREPGDRFLAVTTQTFADLDWLVRFWTSSQRWADSDLRRWLRDWVQQYEERAVVIRWWEPLLVPGLLQTEDYARALCQTWRRDGGDVEHKVAARIGRQRILDRADPPDLRVLVDEPVLSRCIGDAAIMARQLAHLAGMARRPDITVQLIPATARPYAGLSGAFAIATMPDQHQVAYLETGVQGMTILDPALVRRTALLFDDLRDEALSRSSSLERIQEVARRWIQQAASATGVSPATAAPTDKAASKSVTPVT
ncbi:MAG: helix-turn-helix transcriptional regulator [Streptosporangiaceae bacterium]|nr:helix-turn-helix transcriptional regulator [Streptosporangiaceae bacterium]